MNKLKRILASLMAATIVAGSMSAINSLAASPKIYVDIVRVNSTTYRADIVFENVPAISSSGFHIQFGEGWNIVSGNSGKPDYAFNVDLLIANHIDLSNIGFWNDGSGIFVTFANDAVYQYDGVIASVNLTRASGYTPESSTAELEYVDGDVLSYKDGPNYIFDAIEESPVMLKSNQYIIGDADGSGSVNSLDASEVLTAVPSSSLLVDTIAPFHTNYFPDAICAAAPDADQNGYINKTDANEILNYYSAVAVGNSYSGKVGKIDVYETFA